MNILQQGSRDPPNKGVKVSLMWFLCSLIVN